MKKLLLLISFSIISLPASAITWEEFWRPFKHERPYYPRYYVPMCDKRVYREEYIPGNYWNPGYARRWTEIIRVPCYDTYR